MDGKSYLEEASMGLANFEKPWVKKRLSGYGSELSFLRIQIDTMVFDDLNLSPQGIK